MLYDGPYIWEEDLLRAVPQRFDGIDQHDRYSNRNVVFFDVCIWRFKHLILCFLLVWKG